MIGTRSSSWRGVYCRLKHPDEWVREFEYHEPPVVRATSGSQGSRGLAEQLGQEDEYHYTCEQEPFKSYCDKEKCMSRKYGIGDEDYVAR